jgi:hypothetical protein
MTIADQIKAYLPAAKTIADVALNIAKVIPGLGSAEAAIELGIKVANGIANEVPIVMQTWKDIQDAAAGGVVVSDAEWAAWQAQVDEAHVKFLEAVSRVESKR